MLLLSHPRPCDLLPWLLFQFQAEIHPMPTLSRATTHIYSDIYFSLADQGTGLEQESRDWISASIPSWYTIVCNGSDSPPPSPGSQNTPGERPRKMLFTMSWPHKALQALSAGCVWQSSLTPRPHIRLHSLSEASDRTEAGHWTVPSAPHNFPSHLSLFSPSPYFSLSQSPRPSSHAHKKDFKLDRQPAGLLHV